VIPFAAELLAVAMAVSGAGAVPAAPTQEPLPPRGPVPFAVGERATYDVKFGFVKAGTASMQVRGITPVRNRDAYHFAFRVTGGIPLYRVDDILESWTDTARFHSLRYVQDQEEGGRKRERRYEIFPERAQFVENDKAPEASVAEPLDDASFLYYVRTLPLEVGKEYSFPRYFKPKSNPVRIRVLRRERIEVPAGRFETIVVQPIIKTRGIFSEGGRAEVWIADDATRAVVQLKSKLPFGSINLYLTKYEPGARP
jgi:hypothetical protein